MGRLIGLLYGVAAYLACGVALLYAIGFVSGLGVPKTIDDGALMPPARALAIDLMLMALFALQPSVLARRSFEAWRMRCVPRSVERSTDVLLASLALALLFWQWRPLPAVVWRIDAIEVAASVMILSLVGWAIVLASILLMDHVERFGLPPTERQPLYLGFVIAFWATPLMTIGHLVFAAMATAYILVGILLEERDLVELLADECRRYRGRVSMLVPWRKKA